MQKCGNILLQSVTAGIGCFFLILVFSVSLNCFAQQAKIKIENFEGMDVYSGRLFVSGTNLSNSELKEFSTALNRKIGGAASRRSSIIIEPINNNLYLVSSTKNNISTKKLKELLRIPVGQNKLVLKVKDANQEYVVEPDYIIHTDEGSTTEAAIADDNWGMKIIGANNLWDLGIKGNENVVVAVLDTGIKLDNKALHIWKYDKNYKVPINEQSDQMCIGGQGFNFRPDNNNNFCAPIDKNGHGTKVAGIIGANGEKIKGVNWNVTILPVKIFNDSDSVSSLSYAIKGIKAVIYANQDLHVNVKVINISYGIDSALITEIDALRSVIDEAKKAGILIVASAGNKSRELNTGRYIHYPGSMRAARSI